MAGDVLSVEGDQQPGEALVHQVMAAGRRIHASPTLDEIRTRAASELARLPEPLRQLQVKPPYTVDVGEALRKLAAATDERLGLKGARSGD
jgi:nicotinate phosphoribosyltransferase